MTEDKPKEELPRRVLVLDETSKNIAENLVPGSLYDKFRGNPLRPNKSYRAKYDDVFAYHVLQRDINQNSVLILKAWDRCLKPGGRLHVFVPALEWVIDNYNIDDFKPQLWQHLYGWDPEVPTRAIFDMKLLRVDCQRAGLTVREARSGLYGQMIDGQEISAGQHYVQTWKPEVEE